MMMQTVEAVLQPSGVVQFLEQFPLDAQKSHHVLVTFRDDLVAMNTSMSEQVREALVEYRANPSNVRDADAFFTALKHELMS